MSVTAVWDQGWVILPLGLRVFLLKTRLWTRWASDKPFSNSEELRLFFQQILANPTTWELNIVTSSFCHLAWGLVQDLEVRSWKALENLLEVKGSPRENWKIPRYQVSLISIRFGISPEKGQKGVCPWKSYLEVNASHENQQSLPFRRVLLFNTPKDQGQRMALYKHCNSSN